MLTTIIIFIISISVLIFVHEFGHFITAKRSGMKVEEFGFGFPPRIWGIKKGETVYSINWIPFGGFVKILGESGEAKEDPKSFASKKAGIRAMVISAGVVMNVFLAMILLIVGNIVGLRVGLTDDMNSRATDIKIQIVQVADNSPAQKAGLRALDEIRVGRGSQGSVVISSVSDVQEFVNTHLGKEIILEIVHGGGEPVEVKIVPRISPPPEEGALGIALAATGIIKYPWYEAIYRGAQNTFFVLSQTVIGYGIIIKNLFTTGQTGAQFLGPIGIASITGQAAKMGFTYLIQFIAIISINLAVINFLPFPALDGGRLLFIIIEKIKRSPLPKTAENFANSVGFFLLIMLMLYLTTKDVLRLF